MARYTMTARFDAHAGADGDAPSSHGPEVLARLSLPDRAVHRSSTCDGTTLTVVVDFRSWQPAAVCRHTVDAVRAAWRGSSGADLGEPVSVRVHPQRPPQPAAGAVGRPREYAWRPDAEGGGDGTLVLVDPGSEPISAPEGPAVEAHETHRPADHGRRRRVPGLGPLRTALPILPRRRHD
jgi:hypothetical protein